MTRKNRAGTFIERAAGWSVRHRARAIGGWLTLVALAVLASALLPGENARNIDPGESGVAQTVLDRQRTYDPSRESVLVQADGPALRATVDDLVATLRRTPVAEVRSPLEPGGEAQLSADGRSGLVMFEVPGPDTRFKTNYQASVQAVAEVAARHPGVRVEQSGDVSLGAGVDAGLKDDMANAETFSLPITLLVLLIVFGSLVAAAVPLLLAASSAAAAFGFIGVLDNWIPVNSAGNVILLLIGMAVGVDYSLFYLRRVREELAAGRDSATALRIAARTSGHVVLVSGLTVMVCLSGLLFTGVGVLQGMALGTIIVVGLAMLGSVTVLPALLAALGTKVDKGRIPWLGRGRTAAKESRAWSATAQRVVRRPMLFGGLAALLLLVLAVPALGMRLQDPATSQSLPRGVPVVEAAVHLQEAFPGSANPVRVVLWDSRGEDLTLGKVSPAIDALRGRIAVTGGLLAEPISVAKVDHVLVVRVPLAGSGTDPISIRALEALRDQVLPATFGQVDGVSYAVGGKSAATHDVTADTGSRTPIVFAFVLVLAFVLLRLAFRSTPVALVSIVLNLLSLVATYGVITWVFQDGHLSSLLGFISYGGVVGWLPLFLFVLLFGLSMDYHIFILSRIRERWSTTGDPLEAVVGGISGSAGVVTSAALIMTAVFGVFVTLSAIEYKMLGLGMAVAVLIDATIVRGVLLPAALALLGSRAFPSSRVLELSSADDWHRRGSIRLESPSPGSTPQSGQRAAQGGRAHS